MSKNSQKFGVTFWGTRGVYPCPDMSYSIFGGNTLCVQAHVKEDHPAHIIFDAGTGLIRLGRELIKSSIKHVRLFLSHVHLDHISGMPFFSPFWDSDWTIEIFVGYLSVRGTRECLTSQFGPPFFPVAFPQFPATVKIHDLDPDRTLTFGDVSLKSFALNHPGGALGYRLTQRDNVLCYSTDTEHIPGQLDPVLVENFSGADLVIYDATYTQGNWKRNWGHSTWDEGIKVCQAANAKKMAMFHHSPDHPDDALGIIENDAREAWPDHVFAAREGESWWA